MMDLLSLSRNAAVFIAVIALLRQVFKRQLPRTAFVVLWLAAAVRMLCPFRLPSAASVWGLFRQRADAAGGAAVRRYWLTPEAGLPVQNALPNVCEFLEKVWFWGMVMLLLGILVMYLGGLREARAAKPLPNGTYLCKGIDSPRLCGIVRPRILLPEGVGEDLLPYVLLHEQVHMRRLDNLWKLLALAAAAVHWFNPAAWVLVILLGRDLEISCDEWVLRRLDGEQRRSYALSLITMAECPRGRSPVACGFSHNPLEERIRNIMTNRKKSMLALSAATAMILCTTSAFATDAPLDVAAAPLDAAEVLNQGTYQVESAEDGNNSVAVTVKKVEEDDVVYGIAEDLEFFTAEEYAAYLEEQKVVLLEEIASGALSQETYDMTIQDMEEVLDGIQKGLLMAAKPFEGPDGAAVEVVVSTPDAAEAEGFSVNFEKEDDGSITATIGEQTYTVTTDGSEEYLINYNTQDMQ